MSFPFNIKIFHGTMGRIISEKETDVFYVYLRGLVVFLLWVVNGNAHYHNEDRILDKSENYILVAPHRTFWDPVYMAFAARPKQFIFMAKKSSSPIVYLLGGLRCVEPFRLIAKSLVQMPLDILLIC